MSRHLSSFNKWLRQFHCNKLEYDSLETVLKVKDASAITLTASQNHFPTQTLLSLKHFFLFSLHINFYLISFQLVKKILRSWYNIKEIREKRSTKHFKIKYFPLIFSLVFEFRTALNITRKSQAFYVKWCVLYFNSFPVLKNTNLYTFNYKIHYINKKQIWNRSAAISWSKLCSVRCKS